VDCVGLTVMHLIGRHQADAGMMMLLIIPIEEVAAERLGILNAAETPRCEYFAPAEGGLEAAQPNAAFGEQRTKLDFGP
jgi:hypothetical protein